MYRQNRFGHNGVGRSLGNSDVPKVARGEITAAYEVDVRTLQEMQDVYDDDSRRSFMKRPGEGGFRLLKDEMAFKVRDGGDAVLTALNGLDAPFVAMFPDNPELVRDLLASIIQPIGVVRQDARTDINEPKVALRVGGTVPQGAPQEYNIAGQENALISTGCAVIYDVPNLQFPVQWGTTASGRTNNKVTLVARAADKRSTATRIQNILGAIVHDPVKFKTAMAQHSKVATAWTNAANTIVRSYKTSFLMGLDLMLQQNMLQFGRAMPTAITKLGTPEEQVAGIAELLGVLDKRQVYAGLTAAERAQWTQLEYDFKQRMLPVPDPQSNKFNARNEFGFALNRQTKMWTSRARVDRSGEPKRTPVGKLLILSLTHLPQMLEAINAAFYDERRLHMGRANSTPSNRGTGRYELMLQPHGGLAPIH